jgi:hypothetical protein
MKLRSQLFFILFVFFAAAFFISCEPNPTGPVTNANTTNTAVNTTVNTNQPANTSPPVARNEENMAANLPVTLAVLDAMFADETFAGELKTKLNLSDEQIAKLKDEARNDTLALSESDDAAGSTSSATRRAQEKIQGIVGADKAREISALVRERWSGGAAPADFMTKANSVPGDTRIVVNAPAFRMDIFKDGQLVRTYKVGIGYPEFPLPVGLRQAKEIIFNPTWTPPDEPWVKGKVKPGQKVEAGSKLNPLGPIKIPIGLPSLIHGGKSADRLGQFASHGCVGLTSPQVQDFALALAQISGTELTDADVSTFEKAKTETKNVKLQQNIPVELRYETIVVEDGKLKIFRDVYERGTNTEENLRRVLEAHGVSFDSLSEAERNSALQALKQMAVDAGGAPVTPADSNQTAANSNQNQTGQNKNTNSQQSGKVTRNIKGQKEIVIEIAALKGKGYPAPVDYNTGAKSKKPLSSQGNKQ